MFHFLENKAKNSTSPVKDDQEGLANADKFLSSHHSSSSTASESETDGSLSITSNIRKLTSGMYHIFHGIDNADSPSSNNSSQDLNSSPEASGTIHSNHSTHVKGS